MASPHHRTLRYYEDGPSSTTTSIQEITLTATSLPDASSTITSINSLEPDVTVIQKLYPTGVGERLTYTDLLDDDDTHETIYKVNLTYSAPSSCSTHWTTTTAVSLNPPAMPTTYTYGVVFVDPTQVPSTSMGDLRDRYHPSSLYVRRNCQYYNYYQNSYYDGDDDWFHGDYWMGISPFALTLILVIGWVELWIILGFIESFVRFRRLMTGWLTRRGLPVYWAITILPITLLLLCYFRKGYRARTYLEAQELTKKWKAMSVWTKLRLFFVWGFRFKYPPMLGPPGKMSKRPGPNLYPPPGVPPMAWAGAVD
ncbi:hypothetical protein NUU61_003664 [Penicillium alfredii]|uniref:Uncharacterized protein n=1 Tax=Penicillium alfredii TaxID=1506179 RepID=A0A9W9FJS1_9EURO|nr:uncharacterized protein NUU61_003664 [Penicillium alfredii]KAJ5101442.1 hypothetical protein NUU61_003664 [Penicillium alfredii]